MSNVMATVTHPQESVEVGGSEEGSGGTQLNQPRTSTPLTRTTPSHSAKQLKPGSNYGSHFTHIAVAKTLKYSNLGGQFSLDEFVQLRPNYGLTKLSTDLHDLFITLGQALDLELNSNAEAIIEACFRLDGCDVRMKGVLGFVERSVDEIEQFLNSIAIEQSGLDNQLAIRAGLREKKKLLQLMIRVTALVSKMERLVGIASSEGDIILEKNQTNEATQGDAKFIERAAVEYSQLRLLLGQGKGLALLTTLSQVGACFVMVSKRQRVEAIGNCILKQAEVHFTQCLDRVIVFKQEDDLVALAQCFRAYDLLGHAAICEGQFASRVVTPAIEQILRGATDPKRADLRRIYDETLAFLNERCGPILKLDHYLCQVRSNLLTNAVFPAILGALSRLAARHYQVFAAADPDAFFQNYSSTVNFLRRFEELFPELGAVKKFRESSAYRDFMKRWPLNVYFRLRAKQLISKLELSYPPQLSKDPRLQAKDMKAMPLDVLGADGFTYLTPYVTLHALVQCWSEGIYVSALAHRFWKLSLQLIARFLNWQRSLVDEFDWELWLKLWQDGLRFREVFERTFTNFIQPKVAQFEVASINDAVQLSLSQLQSQNRANAEALVSCLQKFAEEKLHNVDSVPLAYRHTNQPLPTAFSPYVVSAFTHLHKLKSEPTFDHVSQDTRQDWIDACLIQMIQSYGEMIQGLLNSLKRTEEILGQLKRNAKPVEVTDEAKIRRQVLLDVQAFGAQVRSLTAHPRVRAALFLLYDIVNDLAKGSSIVLE
ncbi:Conserved oligomeric Golgi complex subunit 2 [Massospora cicadina]|nr:Conserved oligomeric Golgi complex subunit 2 [Massospora cicadina]